MRRRRCSSADAVPPAVPAGYGWARPRGVVGRLLRGSPTSSHPVPSGPAGQVVSGTFRSAARRAVTGWSVAYPAAVMDGLPVLVVLHGRSNDYRDAFGSHYLDRYLSAAVRSGVPAFAIASVDGGHHSYWHKRTSGEDPQAMIVEELLPLLAARGLRTHRVALGGWSMGGDGALLLASRLGASRGGSRAARPTRFFRECGRSCRARPQPGTSWHREPTTSPAGNTQRPLSSPSWVARWHPEASS